MKTLKMIMLIALVAVGTTVFASIDTKTTKSPEDLYWELIFNKVTASEVCNASTVTIPVKVTFSPCPFECLAPCNTIYVVIHNADNSFYTYRPFDGNCSLDFGNQRLEEGTTYYVEFVNPNGCPVVWESATSNHYLGYGLSSFNCLRTYCP